MAITPEISALLGALIGIAPGIITPLLTRKSDERKQIRELAVRSAIEAWKTRIEHAQPNTALMPLEVYITHTTMMCDFALSGSKIDPESMQKHLNDVQSVMDVMIEHASTPRK